jgi:hypothetical protein
MVNGEVGQHTKMTTTYDVGIMSCKKRKNGSSRAFYLLSG